MKATKELKSFRKKPGQARSKMIVDSIYEATIRILSKLGNKEVTTTKISEVAGISVGSLYQYFPNKDSVLTAIMDRVAKTKFAEIQKRIELLQGKTMLDATNAMVDLGLEIFLSEKEKIREIFRSAPELGQIPGLLKLRQLVVERLAEEMKVHHPGLPHGEYVRVSFVAVNSLMGVVHTMLYDEEQAYSIEALSFELKAMLFAYFEARTRS